jgi:hypothetical protein
MPIPKPEPGLVIRFDYLFDDPQYAVRHYDKLGEKERPCVIVVAVREAATGQIMVTIAPITASEPLDKSVVVEIPQRVRQNLGLAGEGKRSWIILDEINESEWPGYDLKTVPETGEFDYGFLPPRLYDQAARRFVELAEQRRVKVSPRHDKDTVRNSGSDVAELIRSAQEKSVVAPKLPGPDKPGNDLDD